MKVKLQDNREVMLILTIALFALIISLISPEFLQFKNLTNILSNNAIFGIMALGMTLIIVTGNIDVSVGAQFAVIGMAVASFTNLVDSIGIKNPIVVLIFGAIIGIILSFINGYLVVKIKLPAVIITLGTMSIMRGLLLIITQGDWVSTVPRWFTKIVSIRFLGVHVPTYIWIIIAISIFLTFKYTTFGRNILAIGGNPIGAIRVGINRDLIYKILFGIYGGLIGIASSIYVAQLGSAQPVAGMGYEMTLIAASIIGGNSILGGKMNVLGTFLGIILIGTINNALVLLQVPVYWQSIVTGMIMVSAILLSYKKDEI